MRVLVCGGSYRTSRADVAAALEPFSPSAIVAAHLIGAPVYARQWGEAHGLRVHQAAHTAPLDATMVATRPDIVLAFPGDHDAVAAGVRTGIAVIEV